ncbi:hypothetical protein SynPROS91_00940 [Synechococcus sp. PROS-9-1]|uniref:hypothetical protein n=1 Tax=Synechococcus sp. PROS-9-1 TaxID=1968775 RepID=UPI00164522B4|nr:hypothetical protein [Synechococcus sp. PROS-9-1]QNJ31327.1 hypothetical protein SynPROS91_00940 [Synechococcus sp. PROS-9-1]
MSDQATPVEAKLAYPNNLVMRSPSSTDVICDLYHKKGSKKRVIAQKCVKTPCKLDGRRCDQAAQAAHSDFEY